MLPFFKLIAKVKTSYAIGLITFQVISAKALKVGVLHKALKLSWILLWTHSSHNDLIKPDVHFHNAPLLNVLHSGPTIDAAPHCPKARAAISEKSITLVNV